VDKVRVEAEQILGRNSLLIKESVRGTGSVGFVPGRPWSCLRRTAGGWHR